MESVTRFVRARSAVPRPRPVDLVRRRWPRVVGGVVALALLPAGAAQLIAGRPEAVPEAWTLAALQSVAILLAWRRPWPAWWLSLVTAVLAAWAFPMVSGAPWTPATVFAHLLVVGLLGLVARPLALGLAVLAGSACLVSGVLLTGAPTVIGPIGVIVLALVAGVAAASGAQRRTASALRAARRDAVAEEARRAVLEERSRIAREMHDVVAHRLSRVAVRAESAPVRVGGVDEPVGDELAEIASDTREALAEMRRLLGVLRSDEPGSTAPVPGLGELPALLEDAGVDLGPLPDGPIPTDVGLAAYRIVQEALHNAARHAAGAPVTGSVRRDGDQLRIEVRNGPGGRPQVHTPGHGVTGMRERAAAVGGTVDAGPQHGGGWAVRASLPVRDG